MKMIQLPNGSFVRADTITAVRPLPTLHSETLHRARVVVYHNQGMCEVLLTNDNEDAVRLAGEIVAQISQTP